VKPILHISSSAILQWWPPSRARIIVRFSKSWLGVHTYLTPDVKVRVVRQSTLEH
jgi:hypothetical protein